MKEHSDLLIKTAEYLLEHESMTGEEFGYLCSHGGELPPAEVKEEPPVITEVIDSAASDSAEAPETEAPTVPEYHPESGDTEDGKNE